MHQPSYFDPIAGQYALPWTYLHAIKDYVDMAAHLEANPAARAVVNFSPTLLEQIEDYDRQIADFRRTGLPIRDPLLAALADPLAVTDAARRQWVIETCTRAHPGRVVGRFPAYARLFTLAQNCVQQPRTALYLSDAFLVDLLMWFHLAMLGETVRRSDPRVPALMAKEAGYTAADRATLLELLQELIGGVIPRYRALAERGTIELAVNPYAHPILPLLIDLASAREALPELPLPAGPIYPGGTERARWQVAEGLRVFERHFGRRPAGCWPAEGAVSAATARMLGDFGFHWIASGSGVLAHSLPGAADPHCPYRLRDAGPAIVFRDDALSDRIGFTYASWHSDDAAADLVQHLLGIKRAAQNPGERLVAIIMDGENAWEHYHENAYHFLVALYQRLATEPELELTTFSAALPQLPPRPLDRLVAGSWIYGTLSTWIGDPQKNRAWDCLIEAKREFDAAVAAGLAPERVTAAEQILGRCEASDWWWWFGRDTEARIAREFDTLFRAHLQALYREIGRPAPAAVFISLAGDAATAGTVGSMRRGSDGA